MKYDLTKLNSNIEKCIDIDFDYEFSKEEISSTDLISLKCRVSGDITKNSLNNYHLVLHIEGNMYMPCAITLNKTKYPFSIDIDDDIDNLLDDYQYSNIIDLYPIVWEYILMEIPMRVVSDEALNYKASGEGWSYKNDEDITSSPFDELKDLL